jgi:hypothetical protein
MNDNEHLVTALVRALRDSPDSKTLRRAVAALRLQRDISETAAYAILVRASVASPSEAATSVAVLPRIPRQVTRASSEHDRRVLEDAAVSQAAS